MYDKFCRSFIVGTMCTYCNGFYRMVGTICSKFHININVTYHMVGTMQNNMIA